MRFRDSAPISKVADHEGKAFRPARSCNPRPYRALHEHKQDYTHVVKNFKDEENGGIMIGPRNVVTAGPKTGNCAMRLASFGGMAAHKADDYNYPKKLAWKELQLH
jgi:hypothetical protein